MNRSNIVAAACLVMIATGLPRAAAAAGDAMPALEWNRTVLEVAEG